MPEKQNVLKILKWLQEFKDKEFLTNEPCGRHQPKTGVLEIEYEKKTLKKPNI